METSDPGADEAAELVEGSECGQHVVSHRSSNTRDEHDTALPQGKRRKYSDIHYETKILF